MIEADEPDIRLGRENERRRSPDAANDITIPDYVMLDFVDEFLASQKNERHRNRDGAVAPRTSRG